MNRRIERATLLVCAGAATLAAWLWILQASVHHHHAGWRSFLSLVVMWQAMMVAMMTPAVVDWLLTFDSLAKRGLGPVAAFAGGYFLVWLGYSVLAALLQMAIGPGGLPARAGGAVLIAAGLLYFTPFQRACLTHCRNPLTYFLTRWSSGPRSGWYFGLTHGAYCVGCCWMLMLTGFAFGVMNVLWMAFLTILICVEKVAPFGERIGAVAAVGMVAWGALLLF